jgi:translation elongation factor EF-G
LFFFFILDEYPTKNPVKFIGFGRVFSGTLKRGNKIIVISPKVKKSSYENDKQKNLEQQDHYIQEVFIQNIYVMMGQFMEGVTQVRKKIIIK